MYDECRRVKNLPFAHKYNEYFMHCFVFIQQVTLRQILFFFKKQPFGETERERESLNDT